MGEISLLSNMKPRKLAVVGLGYVGLPLAVAFAKHNAVIGFDLNHSKIEAYKKGFDVTQEVGDAILRSVTISYTSDPIDLAQASIIVVAVPTPVDNHKIPDLRPVISASETVGRYMRKGTIVIYESTVYPGVTEEICIPILEKASGMTCGSDFKVGYSPERINPGDKVHRLENITKIVAGTDSECLEIIAETYAMIIDAGVYRSSSIKVAEAAKVIENAQRDINIAFVNELSMIFNRMGIDTLEVLRAAGTKWNFLGFQPGLVGGHCIGVDPYYLTYKAQELGYHPEVILAGRRINDGMGKYVAENTIKQLIKDGCTVNTARVGVLGLTFKENVPDARNTRVVDIIKELREYGVAVAVCDPYAEPHEVEEEYGISLAKIEDLKGVDAVIIAVAHDDYRALPLSSIRTLLSPDRNVLVDVKGIYDRSHAEQAGFRYWRL